MKRGGIVGMKIMIVKVNGDERKSNREAQKLIGRVWYRLERGIDT